MKPLNHTAEYTKLILQQLYAAKLARKIKQGAI
jgi:hypothetical protein